MPVDKSVGDAVFAGTVNQTGAIEFRVTAAANDSTLARIIHAVEAAQGARAPMQRFVDRFAALYTPAVFAIAVAVAVLMPLLAGLPWLQAAYKALVLLVIACPCALVISTPITIVSGLAAAARKGILIKGGIYLEQARQIKAVALDKTGTVTEGKPRLVHRESLASAEVDVEALAASLAMRSDHPVSRAIAAGLPAASVEVADFEALPGHGVQGRVGGRRVLLGNHALLHARGLCDEALEARIATHESAGRTVTLLAAEDRVLALFAVADTLKSTSTQAVAELGALGVVVVMLTGDNARTARAVATAAGISDARGDLLPQDKQSAIQDLQRSRGLTAMIGDGINDAPSLAQSDIGFAMGGAGTDIAIEAADVVIMNDDLRRVATTIGLSRKTHAVLWQNIALALGIKVVFLVLAVFGNATMWMAVFADMGASLLVVGNGLRLLRS
jgi:Cd2+/Zn2+-exporting ATPase